MIKSWLLYIFLFGITTAIVKDKLKNDEVPDLLSLIDIAEEAEEESITRFFVVGDFGDTQAKEDINHVTDTMAKISSTQKYEFIATVGDNIYENGIESMEDLSNADEIMKFFKKPTLEDIPMYLTLGNHDWYSDFRNELKYSEHDPQWNMESDYYTMELPMKDDPSKTMVLLMVNSCKLLWLNKIGSNKKDWKKMNVEIGSKEVEKHYDWLQKKLKKYSNNTEVAWLGVVMHHPVLIEPSLKRDFLNLLRSYMVDILIVGHKHMFEYANIGFNEQLKYPDGDFGSIINDCKHTDEILNSKERVQQFKKGELLHQFLIGGSGREFKEIWPYRDQDGQVYFQNTMKHGMATIEVTSDMFRVSYHNEVNSSFYQVTINS